VASVQSGLASDLIVPRRIVGPIELLGKGTNRFRILIDGRLVSFETQLTGGYTVKHLSNLFQQAYRPGPGTSTITSYSLSPSILAINLASSSLNGSQRPPVLPKE